MCKWQTNFKLYYFDGLSNVMFYFHKITFPIKLHIVFGVLISMGVCVENGNSIRYIKHNKHIIE